jgi:ABC-2 type transport system permease protein
MFLVVTIGGPVLFAFFVAAPVLIAGVKAGGPARIAVVDETGRMFERLRDAFNSRGGDVEEGQGVASNPANQNSADRLKETAKAFAPEYAVELVPTNGRSLAEVMRDLDERVKKNEFDGYLVLPKDVLEDGQAHFYARNVSDITTSGQIESALTRAVRDARLDERGVSPDVMRAVNQPVNLTVTKASEAGGEADTGQGFYLAFGAGFVIYLTILLYGQVILGAVIEEKETRIAEILFSSIRSFPLMMGKLIGVSLVAVTQFAIWGLAFAAFALYGAATLAGQGMNVTLPHVAPSVFVYLILFFLLGYFIYATIYALVGSMVTTAQEGGQLAMPIILILVVAFYLAFPVMRSPDSQFAFWVSMIPFFAPITMLMRVVVQTPPFWQIALSLAIGFATVVLLLWLASRVYRVGMLMYGKRATIPEMLKWIRQP